MLGEFTSNRHYEQYLLIAKTNNQKEDPKKYPPPKTGCRRATGTLDGLSNRSLSHTMGGLKLKVGRRVGGCYSDVDMTTRICTDRFWGPPAENTFP